MVIESHSFKFRISERFSKPMSKDFYLDTELLSGNGYLFTMQDVFRSMELQLRGDLGVVSERKNKIAPSIQVHYKLSNVLSGVMASSHGRTMYSVGNTHLFNPMDAILLSSEFSPAKNYLNMNIRPKNFKKFIDKTAMNRSVLFRYAPFNSPPGELGIHLAQVLESDDEFFVARDQGKIKRFRYDRMDNDIMMEIKKSHFEPYPLAHFRISMARDRAIHVNTRVKLEKLK